MSQEVPAKINHLRESFSSSPCKIRNPPRSTNNTKKMADTAKPKAKKADKPAAYPPCPARSAIKGLGDKTDSSRQAILRHLMTNNKIDADKPAVYAKLALRKLIVPKVVAAAAHGKNDTNTKDKLKTDNQESEKHTSVETTKTSKTKMTIIKNTAPTWPHSRVQDLADQKRTPLLADPPPQISTYDAEREENHIPYVNPWQLLRLRCLTQPPAMIPIKWNKKHTVFTAADLDTGWPMGPPGMLRGVPLRAMFVAIARMPLGACKTIFFSPSLFTMVMSYIMLQDRCAIWRYLVATTHLARIIALPRPPPSLHKVLDNAGIGLCTSHLVLHSHGKHGRFICSGLAFGLGVAGPIVSNIGILTLNKHPIFHKWEIRKWVLMVCLASTLRSIMMTKAPYLATPSKATVTTLSSQQKYKQY